MNVTCICVTYNRPTMLGRAIHCFLQQTDPNARLLILDDAGQYEAQGGPNWQLCSTSQRYLTLGDKRNAAIERAIHYWPETDGLMSWDDDDVYWPWATLAIGAALERGPWAQPSVVYEPRDRGDLSGLRRVLTYKVACPKLKAYGGSWAWKRKTFETLGGYPHISNGEDQRLALRALDRVGPAVDPVCDQYPEPYYLYNRRPRGEHISDLPDAYTERGRADIERVSALTIGWNGPNIHELPIKPGVDPRPW